MHRAAQVRQSLQLSSLKSFIVFQILKGVFRSKQLFQEVFLVY